MVEKLLPKLRFNGYEDEWKCTTIEEITKIVGGGTPKTNVEEYWDGEIKWFTPSEIGKTKYVLDSERHITEKGLKHSSAKLLPENTILLSSRATIGEISIALTECSTNQGFQSLITNNNVNNDFVYYLISTRKNEFIRRSSGSTFLEISKNEIKKIPVTIPVLSEQKKISNFFSAIDTKIELLENKYQYYQDLENYLMQQIFTQEIRFDNYENDWNWINFEDIFKSISTKKYQIKSSEINEIGSFEVIDQGQQDIAGYNDDSSKLFKKLPIIIYGDHTTFVKYRNKPFIVGADGVKLLSLKIDANIKYMYYALKYFNIKPEGYKRHYSIIKKIDLPVPSLSEQNYISNFFSNFDEKIRFIKCQIENTKEFKRGLFQKMFI